MTVRQYLASVTSTDIVESLAFDRIDVPEEWQRHAHLCHLIDELVRGDKARDYESFLPERYRPKKKMSSAEMKSRFRAAATGNKPRVNRGRS